MCNILCLQAILNLAGEKYWSLASGNSLVECRQVGLCYFEQNILVFVYNKPKNSLIKYRSQKLKLFLYQSCHFGKTAWFYAKALRC